ncbi:MAG: helix-hairpin-helix domain-containing protein [Raineya sp.]
MKSNNEISDIFSFYAFLLELHNENEFKVRNYRSVVFKIDKMTDSIAELSTEQIRKTFGKSTAEQVLEILEKGSFAALEALLALTPEGVLQMAKIKGLGAKRLRVLWQEAGIDSPEALSKACEENKIAAIKGFGEKIQETIKNNLLFIKFNSDKLLYADAEPFSIELEKVLLQSSLVEQMSFVGDWRRAMEVIEVLGVLVQTSQIRAMHEFLNACTFLEPFPAQSGVYVWRGNIRNSPLKVEIYFARKDNYGSLLFQLSASPKHLAFVVGKESLLQIAQKQALSEEKAVYLQAGLPYLPPEIREGQFEFLLMQTPKLLETQDLKGTLHNHSTYSDGKNSVLEMAQAAKKMGLEYLGITDHSKSAYYANGLDEERVLAQHKEIDQINAQYPDLCVFKGIEADILSNGDLDYSQEFLKNFDFVVASIHSNLQMNEAKATERMIKAIENPYTTIIGHPTGRLLLRRRGYPLNMQKIIDACLANEVALEVNAHPLRLDLDWRWIHQALEKGVKISINADAHDTEGLLNHRFGVLVARKGGLTPEMCLNCMDKQGIRDFFAKKRGLAANRSGNLRYSK